MPIPKVASMIADRLNAIGVEWMTTGSIAAMTYGKYRVTNDIDLVLVLDESDISRLVSAFPLEDFYCPPGDVIREEAGRTGRGHFNLIHHETGFKADIYLAGSDAFSRWALQRRQRFALGDSSIWVAPPEFVILGKLEFYREGRSEKHVRDIRGMLAVTEIDLGLLEAEIARRGLQETWAEISSAR
jgi:hypothetical protein